MSVTPGSPAVATLTLTSDGGTPLATDQVVVINASSGSLTHSASVLLQVASSPAPSVGSYPTSFVVAGTNKNIAPSTPPVGSGLTATASAGFTGTLSVDGISGVVSVTNGGPAGTSPTITVKASNGCGTSTTTFSVVIDAFSDDPLVAGATTAKAAHIAELRSAVRAAAAIAGQSPVFTDDPLPPGAPIKAVHITELRDALATAFAALHLTLPTFTDPVLIPGVTPVKAVHVQELRNALK
jgi:hypothetical protein